MLGFIELEGKSDIELGMIDKLDEGLLVGSILGIHVGEELGFFEGMLDGEELGFVDSRNDDGVKDGK